MPFRPDKLTVKAQEALQRAQHLAEEQGQQHLKPLHLLKSLMDEEQGVVRPLLEKIGANVGQLQNMVDSEIDRLPKVSGTGMQVAVSPEAMKVLLTVSVQETLTMCNRPSKSSRP